MNTWIVGNAPVGHYTKALPALRKKKDSEKQDS